MNFLRKYYGNKIAQEILDILTECDCSKSDCYDNGLYDAAYIAKGEYH